MFNSILGNSITLMNFSVCLLTSLVLGLIVAFVHMKTTRSNSHFVSTLAVLPMLVTTVILLVNGNLGTAVALGGAFSLVRFRSIPGNSKEIANVFFAMSIGLACGTGFIGYATIFTLIVSLVSYLLYITKFGEVNTEEKILNIVIPEDLDYTNAFDEIFNTYTRDNNLVKAKTINMGSMFELTYRIKLNKDVSEKEFIDALRIRNGNLKVSLTHPLVGDEL